ncbi:hypothetical protein [Mesorhizobium sp.]|uniref:hypothetical protein n=1 Tax=Mesorhizobium sp. TaxID=1871066 RepID=UPI000FE94A48|nr:hypothetical protein [Mesorhizobium sp.]RWB67607.1 MAG: hypothetical protein EOQ49_25135 [Mesorhizobium sp.]
MIKGNIAKLPKLRLTLREFNELLEYSASYPTGTRPGKRWKRLDGAHDHGFIRSGGKPAWMIGEYDPTAPSDDEIDAMKKRGETPPKDIKINWYRPVIALKAADCVRHD